MTGPEHYQEAERLIQTVEDGHAADTMLSVTELTALARVHAALALAAATGVNENLPIRDYDAWQAAAGTKPERAS